MELKTIEKEYVDIPTLVAVGSVSTVLLIVVIFATQAWFYYEQKAEIASKEAANPNWALRDINLKQHEKINNYRWMDQKKQIAAIPIDDAIKLTAKSLGR
ncbi:MAG: hypothetical protein JKX85_14395 [Phycisphaeraceae bacterium]|nr:hypothetical protein [Phycisphaeraceae bacterium]